MKLKIRKQSSKISPSEPSPISTPSRLRPAQGLVIGVALGLIVWAILIGGFFLRR